MLRAQCVNLVEFDICRWRISHCVRRGWDGKRSEAKNECGPHIDPKVLKRDYGRVELAAETYVDVADVLFGYTRHAPET
jgi:hypothetical protein